MRVDHLNITQLARELRKNPTPSELLLWQHLRGRKLGGYRFIRQKPFVYYQLQARRYFFIADFYNASAKLVIELDGKVHEHQRSYDYNRDKVLQGLSIRTLRITNSELEHIEKVKKKILNALKEK